MTASFVRTARLCAMLGAVKTSLGKDFSKAKDFAKPEFQRLAKSLVENRAEKFALL